MKEYDVIVVGSGLAGVTAAIAAAEQGAHTVIIEKMPVFGGSSRLSVGAFAACGTAAQKRTGIADNKDKFYEDIMKYGDYTNIARLVEVLASKSAAAFKFITDRGADYPPRLFAVEGHSEKRCFQPPAGLGKGVLEPLMEYFLKLPDAELLLNTEITDIKHTESTVVLTAGAVKYRATRGVIFAGGGYEREICFQDPKLSKYAEIPTSTHKGATADSLKMLMRAGAQTSHTEYIRFGTSIAYNDIEKGTLIDGHTSDIIASNELTRQQFAERLIDHAYVGDNIRWPILILDSDSVKKINNDEKLEAMISSGELQRFNSPYELERFFNISTNKLPYKENQQLYACVVYPKLNYTQGGVLIDENAQILDTNSNPIPRLYAAGEITGGVHGKARLTACSTTDCVVYGIIAGQNAAKVNYAIS